MTQATAPDQAENSPAWAFLHTFLRNKLLRSLIDGSEGQRFVQITAGNQIHHLTDAEDAFDFVHNTPETVHGAQDGGR
ncbi:hypothetical protein AB0B15_11630 [Streptomyces sp. NPDC045456]|uniref:hypothetical protein n=1 Tax=Streptomyces sp. NPDC045456 TaxID=3155254 RepID=UPI0033D78E19